MSILKTLFKKEQPKGMKSFKQLVERVLEEASRQSGTKLEVEEHVIDKLFRLKIIDRGQVKGTIMDEDRDGFTQEDIDKAYGQLLKKMAVAGVLATKSLFDSGAYNRKE